MDNVQKIDGFFLSDIFPKFWGTTGYITFTLSFHHTGNSKARMEEEQVGEGREEVGDTRGPVCSPVLTDLPKLRRTTGYTTFTLSLHHTGNGKARREEGRQEERVG